MTIAGTAFGVRFLFEEKIDRDEDRCGKGDGGVLW
jgi:hypothetical protein